MNDKYDEKKLKRKPKINLTEAFKKYYVEYAQHLKSGKEAIRFQIRNLSRFFGDTILLHEVNDNMLNKYVVYRRAQIVRGKGTLVSPSTVNRELAAFRKMYNLAKDVWNIEVAECNIKSHFLTEPDQHQEYLTEAEQEALISHAPNFLKNPIRFSLITGVRRQNVKDLTWADIKLDDNVMVFKIKSSRPEGKIHTLPIIKEIREILDSEAVKNPSREGIVFRNNKGRKLGDFRKSLYTAFEKAGIARKKGHGFHLLRHSSATTKLKNGVNIVVVKQLLGHSDLATTMRYSHVNSEQLKDAMEKQQSAQNPHKTGGSTE